MLANIKMEKANKKISTQTTVKADVSKYNFNCKIFLKHGTSGQFQKYDMELFEIWYWAAKDFTNTTWSFSKFNVKQ